MRALAFAALLSCGHSEIRWSLPASMPEPQRAAFVASCERWNRVAVVRQSIGEGDRRVVIRLRSEMANCGANAETNGTEMRLPEDAQAPTMMHELGHALGLGHIEGPGVMATTATGADLTAGDIDECQRVEACHE
jgi:hypothetical protein